MTGARRSPAVRTGAPAATGTPGWPDSTDAVGAGRGGQPAPGDGAGIARLSPGDGRAAGAPDGAIPPEYEAYVRALRQRIQDRLVYPWAAVRRGQQGVVELEVRLGADGRLVGVEVVAGASAETLRGAAVSAVRGSAPFPFPPGLAARPLVVRLPVEFRLR
jgi:periplasmic protein TonB